MTMSTLLLPPSVAAGLGTAVLLGCWLTLLVLGVRGLLGLRDSWHGEAAAERNDALVLALFSIAVVFFVAPMAPEIRWRLGYSYSSWWLAGLDDIQKYGLSLPLFMRLGVGVLGSHDWVPHWINAVLGGLCVLPMVAFVRALGGSRSTAWWSGFAVAVTPLHVRFAMTDGPFTLDTFASLLTYWAVVRYGQTSKDVWLVVAVASLVTTVQCRTESLLTCGLVVLLALAAVPTFPWRRRQTWWGVAAVALLLVPHVSLVLPPVLGELSSRYGGSESVWASVSLSHFMVFNASMQPWPLIVLSLYGLLNVEVAARSRLWMLGALFAMALILPDVDPDGTSFTLGRYQFRSVLFAMMLTGLGMGHVMALARSRWAAAALVVGGLWSVRMASKPTLLTIEYEVFADNLALVPEGCSVFTWLEAGDTTLFPPIHLSQIQGRDLTWLGIVRNEMPETGCVAYWKTGACSGHYVSEVAGVGHRAEACAAFEARWPMTPIVEVDLVGDPNGPMGLPNRFPDEMIPVGFYRVWPNGLPAGTHTEGPAFAPGDAIK